MTDLKPGELVFCWDTDNANSYRRKQYGEYKLNRKPKEYDEQEIENRVIAYTQFDELKEILPDIGFINVFSQEGIEADDIIAKIVTEDAVIVSSDNDLWQVLGKCQGMYRIEKGEIYSKDDFINEWGIPPEKWVDVKAIAGDKSDNLAGVDGIGLKTAAKYIRGDKVTQNVLNKIDDGKYIISTNRKLVRLPYPLTNEFTILPSFPNFTLFETFCMEIGFRHFLKPENYKKWGGLFDEFNKKT